MSSTNVGSRLLGGPPPRRTPLARFLGPLLAIALVALGVVGIQALAASQQWTREQSWITAVVDSLDGLEPTTGVLVVVSLAGVIGLVLLLTAIAPPRRSHRYAGGDDGAELWITADALAEVAADAADRADGVLTATARATRRGVRVTAVARGAEDKGRHGEIEKTVRSAVTDRLGDLPAGRLHVNVKEETA